MFGKNKKMAAREMQREQELQNQRLKEEIERKEQLQRQIEEAEKMAAEAMKNNTPYRFSVPDPMPKELVSVLKDMFKKLFPDVRKAYLVYTQYEEKAGYLLVVDIDAKFHKIINLYLDGETKKVRNGLPIECILYAKSGALTEGMEPIYQKEVIDTPKMSGSFVDLAALGISTDFSFDDVFDFGANHAKTEDASNDESGLEEVFEDETLISDEEVSDAESVSSDEGDSAYETPANDEELSDDEPVLTDEETDESVEDDENVSENEPASEDVSEEISADEGASGDDASLSPEATNTEIKDIEFKIEETVVKVKPETKQQLFALMNRAGKNASEDVLSVAISGFGEFEFYIPCICDENSSESFEITASCPDNAQYVHLVNCDSGIKATVFFTDEEDAVNFAQAHNYQLAKIKYSDFKASLVGGAKISEDVEGIIINPCAEEILLPPDYPLL